MHPPATPHKVTDIFFAFLNFLFEQRNSFWLLFLAESGYNQNIDPEIWCCSASIYEQEILGKHSPAAQSHIKVFLHIKSETSSSNKNGAEYLKMF